MSRPYLEEKVREKETAATLAWAGVSAVIVTLFLIHHPARPLFGVPGGGGGESPWAGHAAAAAGAATTIALLLPGGLALRRLLGIHRAGGLTVCGLGALYGMGVSFLLLAAGSFRAVSLAPALLLPLAVLLFPSRSTEVGAAEERPAGRAGKATPLLLSALAFAGFTVITLQALAPLTANDSLVYHFSLAAKYAATGGFTASPWNMYARVPHGIELLYAAAYLTGAEGAARLVWLLLIAGNLALAARISKTVFPGSGAGAAFLLVTTPLFLDPRTVGNVDAGAAFFLGLSALHILRFRRGGAPGDLIAAGLFAAGLLWVKPALWIAWPVLPLYLVLTARPEEKGKMSLPLWAFFLLPSAAAVLPWLIRASICSGSALFPLRFPEGNGAEWDASLASQLRTWQMTIGMGRRPVDFLLLPWNTVLNAQPVYARFDGVLSPLYLLLLPVALVRGGRAVRRLLAAAAAGFLLWSIGPQQLRFLSPVLLLAAAALGAGAIGPSRRRRAAASIRLSVIIVAGALLLAPSIRRVARDTLPVVIGRESREGYLARKVQSYEFFRLVDRLVPPGGKILLVWENRVYYSPRPVLADSFFEASQVIRLADRRGSGRAFLEDLKRRGIGWIAVNRSLQRVFERNFAPHPNEVLAEALRMCEKTASRKGIDLYRIPR